MTNKIDKWALFDRIGYKVYHDSVRQFHDSKARVKVACAPRRSTKSYCASHDALDTILTPNTRTWIVGPSYGLAEKEFRYIHDILVINRAKLGIPDMKPITCMTNPRSGQLYIKFPWGAIVEGKTADRPQSLLGEAVDCVIYSEAAQIPRAIRERYVAPTLITTRGIELIPTTPMASAEWVHELWTHGQESKYPEIESFHWDVTANPDYDMKEFEKAKEFYREDSPVFREQYLGEWVFYGGLVFATYSDDIHIIEPFEIPKNWTRLRGIDFGHRDPFVCLWCAIGPDNEMYFYREYYNREGVSMREHASNIKGFSSGERITQTVGDPQAKQSIDDLCYEGIPCSPANHDRMSGRLRVLEYLLPTEDGPPPFPLRDEEKKRKKSPRMYFFNTLVETTREFRYYRWKEGVAREDDKEKTEGEDHAMDVVRYISMERPSPFRVKGRVPSGSFLGWMRKYRENRNREQYVGRQ